MIRTGASEVDARIIYVREDGGIKLDSWTFDVFTLEEFADELDVMLGRVTRARLAVAQGDVRVSTGSHCAYCPAMPACPAHTALARSMMGDVDILHAQLAAMTPEQRGNAWDKARTIERVLGNVLDGLKALAHQEEFPLPNGQTVKEIPFARSAFNQGAAIALLRGKGATDEEIGLLFSEFKGTQIRAVGKATKKDRAA